MTWSIEMSDEQYLGIREFGAKGTRAEVDAECVPSGLELIVCLDPVFGPTLSVRQGSRYQDLGDVELVEKKAV